MKSLVSRERMCVMVKAPKSQKGSVLVFLVVLLPVIIAFAAMAIDVGYWYVMKAELSKSVDAAALAGARNVGSPTVGTLVNTMGLANFPARRLGAPLAPTFQTEQDIDNHTFKVTGIVTPARYFSYWMPAPALKKSAKGKLRKVEIVLVLDRSTSMSGVKMCNLKYAAYNFVNTFTNTQATDRLGLVSFGTNARVDVENPITHTTDTNNVVRMKQAIGCAKRTTANNVTTCKEAFVDAAGVCQTATTANKANGLTITGTQYTNAEEALAHAIPLFHDQSALPDNDKASQFVIFFSDGDPTVFTHRFKFAGRADFDAAVYGTSTPTAFYDPVTGNAMSFTDLSNYAVLTALYKNAGDGGAFPSVKQGNNIKYTATGSCNATNTKCCRASGGTATYLPNFLWYVFAYQYPFSDGVTWAITPPVETTPVCRPANASTTTPAFPSTFIATASRNLAIDHATTIKNHLLDNTIKVYAIGVEVAVDSTFESFLKSVASNPDSQYYYSTTASGLDGIFNRIARDIPVALFE